MICPICGEDALMRKGTKVFCVNCHSEGECDISDTPVRNEDVVITVNLYDECNCYIGTKIHRGLEKINYIDLSKEFVSNKR